ncbi:MULTISPECIES: hypothetical protein [unclassified Caballeronia]|uniref:hypothetical protein n=1 Tax=unclassified Caballeronia TaxID=2646786 RepID=UPI0028584A98|nr:MULTISPECIES: hypothetical protein [unclassified Caballeronia]MDR5741124.1 hypothetical protein [Caballeronia sp. LZ016]MDR5807024.1 hypothetical protein [Caballeronia sp. LZ019]
MDLEFEEAQLRKADKDVAQAEQRIRHQEKIVLELRTDGHDTSLSLELLETMRTTLRAMCEHRRQIVEHIDLIKRGIL